MASDNVFAVNGSLDEYVKEYREVHVLEQAKNAVAEEIAALDDEDMSLHCFCEKLRDEGQTNWV